MLTVQGQGGGRPAPLPDLVAELADAGWRAAADAVASAARQGALTDVDRARLMGELLGGVGSGGVAAEIARRGPADAFLHRSGSHDLRGRVTEHGLVRGEVRLGRTVKTRRNPLTWRGRPFGVDLDTLTTSMLVIGPPGSGKTRSFAVPILEHLCLQALANSASVLVIDPKGDYAGVDFDATIDPRQPTCGFDLYGGAEVADEAADRLASALLPPSPSADKAYFLDASRNALYQALAPYRAAWGEWPSVPALLRILRGDGRALQSLSDRLKSQGLWARHEHLLDARAAQRGRRDDPAASMTERLGLLDRPYLSDLFEMQPRLSMQDIAAGGWRVRLALPEARYPDASLILSRLAVAQFVTTAAESDPGVFKGLLVDEAGRYVDEYVTRGLQRLRASNAGLVLLSQSLGDFPEALQRTIFGSVGCKAVFAGLDPTDADHFSTWWGTSRVSDVTWQSGRSRSHSVSPRRGIFTADQETFGTGDQSGVSVREIDRPLWSTSEVINDVPPGHALVSLSRPAGVRSPPLLVDLRA